MLGRVLVRELGFYEVDDLERAWDGMSSINKGVGDV
jgi:hypothetical protein